MKIYDCLEGYKFSLQIIESRAYVTQVSDVGNIDALCGVVREWLWSDSSIPVYSVLIRGEGKDSSVIRVVMPEGLQEAADGFMAALGVLQTKAGLSFVNCDDNDALLGTPILVYTQYGFEVLLEQVR